MFYKQSSVEARLSGLSYQLERRHICGKGPRAGSRTQVTQAAHEAIGDQR